MDKSLVNILTEARDSLTPETWRKGKYFQLENNTLCMCAHGAIQKIVNPKVKQYLEKSDITEEAPPMRSASLSAVVCGYVKNNPHKPLLQIWNERPDLVKKDYGYGTTEAHYLLGMVGLTIKFNDDANTTLDMVKNKFNQAIELAKLIETS